MWHVFDQSEKNLQYHNYWHLKKPEGKLGGKIVDFVTTHFKDYIVNINCWKDSDYIVAWLVDDASTAVFRVYDAGKARDGRPHRWMIVCKVVNRKLMEYEFCELLDTFVSGDLMSQDEVSEIFISNDKLYKDFDLRVPYFTSSRIDFDNMSMGSSSSFLGLVQSKSTLQHKSPKFENYESSDIDKADSSISKINHKNINPIFIAAIISLIITSFFLAWKFKYSDVVNSLEKVEYWFNSP